MPMSGVMREILEEEEECRSMRVEEVFFSVARTMPFVAGRWNVSLDGERKGYWWVSMIHGLPLIPSDVTP